MESRIWIRTKRFWVRNIALSANATSNIFCLVVINEALLLSNLTLHQENVNPNPHCLGIFKAFFVKMKISPRWLKQNIF
jgi:hypothetical protein